MKKIFSMILCLVMICCLVTPSMAAGAEVVFNGTSIFAVGGTVTIDKILTAGTMRANGLDELLEGYLAGNVQYYWIRNGFDVATGTSLTLTENDEGCEFFVIAAIFRDAEMTDLIDNIYSQKFTVAGAGSVPMPPEILTKSIPDGTVGVPYYQKLECTDPTVTYSLFNTKLPDGLTLTPDGIIQGTPIETGFFHIVILATPTTGSDYATSEIYEMFVNEPTPQYSMEIMRLPNKITYTAGEKLDMKGLWVRIYTPDGYLDSYDGKYLTYSKKALVTLGEQKIKLSYEDAFEFFIVTVVAAPTEPPTEAPVEVTEPPTEAPTEDSADPTEQPHISATEVPTENTTTEPTQTAPTVPQSDTKDPDSITTGTTGLSGQISGNSGATTLLLVILIAVAVIATAGIAVLLILLLKRRNR